MNLLEPTRELFLQLKNVIKQLTPEDFCAERKSLSGATIGKHVRHIIELFQELKLGYTSGLINYEARKRDFLLENNAEACLSALDNLLSELSTPDKDLTLCTDLETDHEQPFTLKTTYYREWLYNIEHTVHHMALIRVGVSDIHNLQLENQFGVAASTMKYKKHLCAQ